jgi:transcription antitermination factor NusG
MGFIGMNKKTNTPNPVSISEYDKMLDKNTIDSDKVEATVDEISIANFKLGMSVKIIDGFMKNEKGVIKSIDLINKKVNVEIEIFGRVQNVTTPILNIEEI